MGVLLQRSAWTPAALEKSFSVSGRAPGELRDVLNQPRPRALPVVRDIVRKAEKQNYRFSALIMGVVTSTPFQMRVAGDEDR